MKLFIPTIGTRLVLAEDWTFHLHDEYRNEKFYKAFHGEIKRNGYKWVGHGEHGDSISSPVQTDRCWHRTYDKPEPLATTLPKGTVIEVDRLYLKKGAGDYDSVTFRLISSDLGKKVKGRFWAKLEEVNTITIDDEQSKKEIRYPDGRFVVSIHERQENRASQNCRCGYHHERYAYVANMPDHCSCDQTQWPRKITHGLHWQQFPEKSGSWKGVTVNHETHSIPGLLSKIEVRKNYSCHSGYHGCYRKDFATIEEMVIWAKKKEFTLEHVEKFVEAFKTKTAPPVVAQED